MFDVAKFKHLLSTQWLGHDLRYFEQLDSTNTYAKQIPQKDISHGLVCLTDNQLKGRGQYERNWESRPNKNLTFTIVFTPAKAERLHVLTLTCALAALEEMENISGIDTCLKWPNDIILNGKKAGGLLTESVFSGNKLDRVLVGVGLNINQTEFSKSLERKATSLKKETKRDFVREKLLSSLLGRLEYKYRLWNTMDEGLLKSINRRLAGYGRWIRLMVNGEEKPGKRKLIGINEQGELLLLNEDADVETFTYEQIRLITD